MRKYSVVLVILLLLFSAAAFCDPLTATDQVILIPSSDNAITPSDLQTLAPKIIRLDSAEGFEPVPMDPDAFFKIVDKNLPKPFDPNIHVSDLRTEQIPSSQPVLSTTKDPKAAAEPKFEEQPEKSDQEKSPLTDPDSYEPDNSASQYTSITPSQTRVYQSHSLHTTTDDDWFRFQAVAGRTYTFYSQSTPDVRIYLYDDAGTTLIASDESSGGTPNDFYLQYSVYVTVYRKIRIDSASGETGSYVFVYCYGSMADGYEDNDSAATASNLNILPWEQFPLLTLDSNSDADWFKVDGHPGRNYHIYSSGNTDTRIYFYGPDGTTLQSWDDNSGTGDNFSVDFEIFFSGDLYLKVTGTGSNTGYYWLRYYCDADPDPYEPDNSASDYTLLYTYSYHQTQEHTIHSESDEDWYRFYAYPGRIYRFESHGYTSVGVGLYNDAGSTLLASDSYGGVYPNFLMDLEFTSSGYYKLKVGGYAGVYTLDYYFFQTQDSFEPDNTAWQCASITPTASEQTRNHTMHNDTDQDWFRFQAIPGRIYRFHSTGNTDTEIYLYEDDGITLINWDDDDYSAFNYLLEFASPYPAYYKLKVSTLTGSAGDYGFVYSYGADPDSYEVDDTAATARGLSILQAEQMQNRTLHSSTDQDWCKLYAIAGRTYTFYSQGNTDVRLYLYQSDGTTQIDYNDNGAGVPNFYQQYTTASNTWLYLKFMGTASAQGAYEFHYSYSTTLNPPFRVTLRQDDPEDSRWFYMNWTPVLNATCYTVEYSFQLSNGWSTLCTITDNHLYFTSSVPNVFVRVRACN